MSASTTKEDAAATGADEAGVPRSVTRVLDLFEVVLSQHTCNLTAAANASKLTPTTALRYLRALEARGYVDRDQLGNFSAGPTILRIAASLRAGTVLDRLASIAQPHLDWLAERSGESAYLAVSDGRTGTYIATAESPRAIRHVGWIGQDVPLDGSALGAALAKPGTVAVRTGTVEADITAMSRALPHNNKTQDKTQDKTWDKLGVALSIVGPEHRFTTATRSQHQETLSAAVDALTKELRTHGEDVVS